MRKSTGWVVFGVAAATVAAGAYYVYKHQDKFFKSEEVITPDGPIQKRNYLALDMEGAKSQINESFTKTKEAAQETIKKVGNKFKGEKADSEDEIIVEEVIIVENAEDAASAEETAAEPAKEDAPSEEAEEKKEEQAEAPKKDSKKKNK